MKIKCIVLSLILFPIFVGAKSLIDTLPSVSNTIYSLSKSPIYLERNNDSFTCDKPSTFSFLTHIPGDAVGYVRQSFKKENLSNLAIIAASTGILLAFDQQITNGAQTFTSQHGIEVRESYSPLIQVNLLGKKTTLMKWPNNINTAFYNVIATAVSSSSGFSLQSAENVSAHYFFTRVKNQDFNYTTNPSIIDANGNLIYSTLINNPQTFITTVGLYNNQNELLAVAKLSRPLVKDFTKEALIKVKLDY